MIEVQKVCCLVKQPLISTNRKAYMGQKESAFVETELATPTFAKTWPTTPQNTTHPNHHSNSNVTICSIHFAYGKVSPLFNTFCIWQILQSVKLLCKHPNNKGQMGSQPITKLYFMKAKVKKKCSSSHYSLFAPWPFQPISHILGSCRQKLEMLSPNITFCLED